MTHYADASPGRSAAGGVGELKTWADLDRAAEVALAARDKSLFMRVVRLRGKMFGGTTRGRTAAGDLAKIDAVLRQIKSDEARDAKRLSSPLARQMAAMSAQCRRIASRAAQAQIAASLKVGRNAPGQLVLPYNRAGSNGDWYPCDDEDAEDALYERHSSTPNDDWFPWDDDEFDY